MHLSGNNHTKQGVSPAGDQATGGAGNATLGIWSAKLIRKYKNPQSLGENFGYRLMDPIPSYYSDLPMNLRFVKLSHHYDIISTDPNPQRMDDDAHL